MQRFFTPSITAVLHNLELLLNVWFVKIAADLAIKKESGEDFDLDWKNAEKQILELKRAAKNLPVSESFRGQVDRALACAKRRDAIELSYLQSILEEISHNFIAELDAHLFLLVPFELKSYYVAPEEITGPEFESVFPDAIKDAHSGMRCYALDEWTASVFHFMRVLEHGIRRLAELLKIETGNIAFENWKNILDQIEKKIRAMEPLPKSLEKSVNLTYLSESATNFRYFKDAWRNHVSHSRVSYDSRDAKRVMDHVIDFMQHLAKREDRLT